MHHRGHPRFGAGLMLLGASLAAALLLPIPSTPDVTRGAILGQVHERLPGWQVERVDASWEGAYTVVTSCAGRDIDFQFVPEHGLPLGDAWLQPSDPYSRSRLAALSDNRRYLVWRGDRVRTATLSCREEIAGGDRHDPRGRPLD